MLIVEDIIQFMDILLRFFDVVALCHEKFKDVFLYHLFDIGVVMKQIAGLETVVYLYEEEPLNENIINKQ